MAQVSADPSDPSAIGVSKAKKAVVKKSPYSFMLSSSIERGLDYYAQYYQSHSFAAVYSIKQGESLSASASYSHPSSGYATFPEDWGFEDVAVSYTKARFFKVTDDSNTSLRIGLGLPTSRVSQRATLLARVNAMLPTSFMFYGNNVVVSTGLSFSQFRYDVADFGGQRLNRPLVIPVSVLISRAFTRNIFGSVNFGITELMDYDFNFIQVQNAGINLTTQLSQKFSLSGGYSWSDTRLSNNSLFDDDRSAYYLSLSLIM